MEARWSLSGRHWATGTTPGSNQVQGEEPGGPGLVPERRLVGDPLVVPLDRLAPVRVEVVGRVRDHQVAARRQRRDQAGHQPGRVLPSGMKCRIASSISATGWPKSRVLAAPVEDRVRVVQVGLDVGGARLRRAGQQGPGVRQHDRVVVDVDDPRLRRDRAGRPRGCCPRSAARCRRRGTAGCRASPARNRTARARNVRLAARPAPDAGRPAAPARPPPVGGEVVLAAEPVVVDARRVRPGWCRCLAVPSPRPSRVSLQESLPPSCHFEPIRWRTSR